MGEHSKASRNVIDVEEMNHGKKRKRSSFISIDHFEKEIEKNNKEAINWRDLPLRTIYKVERYQQVFIEGDDDDDKEHWVADLKGNDDENITVWLCSIAVKKIKEIKEVDKKNVYLRSLGLKRNKKGTRDYHNVDIVTIEN